MFNRGLTSLHGDTVNTSHKMWGKSREEINSLKQKLNYPRHLALFPELLLYHRSKWEREVQHHRRYAVCVWLSCCENPIKEAVRSDP